jgi:glycogen debranching enzyme
MNELKNYFYDLGNSTIRSLETETGILASARSEIFGCIFGRDSIITSLKLIKAYQSSREDYFLSLVKKTLLNLALLQGKEKNIESGEELGKIIHEYRTENFSHLTGAQKPWYLYPDNIMRNYDSVDSTPLFLMACFEFYKVSGDEQFLEKILPHIRLAFDWILAQSGSNKHGFVDYRVHPDRTFGGLSVQSWMDSKESIFHEDGSEVEYSVAPVEVQAYAYASMKMWAEIFKDIDPEYREVLLKKSSELKDFFNKKFVFASLSGELSIASGIDGKDRPITSSRSSMGHILWAVFKDENGVDSILDKNYIPLLVKRLLEPDLFEPSAGIRTLSTKSNEFKANSYHNGSIWPHDTSMIAEGFDNFGFSHEASQVRNALFSAWNYFKTPLELFVYEDGQYLEYKSLTGQMACREQAWSAASMLSDALVLG